MVGSTGNMFGLVAKVFDSVKWWHVATAILLMVTLPSVANAVDNPPAENGSAVVSGLSPAARDIAEQLGIMTDLAKLEAYRNKSILSPAEDLDRLHRKQNLLFRIGLAQLEVRDVVARIEYELSYINRLSGVLEDRRDKAIKLNSIENVVASGGLSEIGNSRSFAVNQISNNVLQLVAGGATIGLGAWALKQQSGGAHRMAVDPNMLAQIFSIKPDEDSTYPTFVWQYLNRPVIGIKQTRLQTLFERWKQFDVIPKNLDTPQGKRRVAVLANTVPNLRANIGVFDDRSDMLGDLRSEVFQIDRDILVLLQCIREHFQ